MSVGARRTRVRARRRTLTVLSGTLAAFTNPPGADSDARRGARRGRAREGAHQRRRFRQIRVRGREAGKYGGWVRVREKGP